MDKHTILFLAAHQTGTAQLDREARSIQAELAGSGHRDHFQFVTRWAAEPLDLLRLLRRLAPAVVHISGHGSHDVDQPGRTDPEARPGVHFVTLDGRAQWVSAEAIAETLGVAGTSVKLVVLNAHYSKVQAEALLCHVPCVIWMAGSLDDRAARSFAKGFYGGLGDGVSVADAYKHGRAAIGLEGSPDANRLRIEVREGIDAGKLVLTANQIETGTQPAVDPPTVAPPHATRPRTDRRRRRIEMGIRTAFADGQGAYVLAMLAFGVAANFLYRTLRPERQYHEVLASLLSQEQEPYRAETHPVLAAGLLPTAAWNLCQDDKLLEATDHVVEQFSAAIRRSLNGEFLGGSLKPCTDREKLPKCPAPTTPLGSAWTDDSTQSTLIIPSTVAELVHTNHTAETISLASQDIENYRVWIDHSFISGTLNSIYFIDLSGGLRFIPPWASNHLPAHRTFAGASYVYSTLSDASPACPTRKGSPTLTSAYLDLVGMGVVRTQCYRIIPIDRVVGVLCFDFSPSQEIVYHMLDEATKLFKLQLVRFYDHGGIEPCRSIPNCPDSLSGLSSSELADLEYEWKKRSDHDVAAGTSAVRMFDDDHYFGATVQRMGSRDGAGWSAVVFGKVQRSPTRDIASAVMMMLFATIASGSIILGVRKKAKRLDVTLIRGLQVGVVELDIRDTIVGANDRAQEIFDTELPAFDMPKLRDARPFGSLIHDTIVLLDDAGLLPPGSVTFSRYESLKLERAIGHSSSYYAIARKSKQVIRISGSTFASPNMKLHTFGTVETFIDEAHKKRVLAAFEAAQGTAQNLTDREGA